MLALAVCYFMHPKKKTTMHGSYNYVPNVFVINIYESPKVQRFIEKPLREVFNTCMCFDYMSHHSV